MSPSLPIDLNRSSGQPLYRQIEHWIRHAIDGGRLPPGTRLPGVRTLARDLGVSVVPVITAYEQLGANGYLVTQVGLGTMVAPDPPRSTRRIDATARTQTDPSAGTGSTRRSDLPATNSWVPDRPPRAPGPREPPTDADLVRRLARSWSRHLHRARLLTDAVSLEPSRENDDLGLVWLRSMLAIRAGLDRADVPAADQLVVTAGVQAAIAAVARTWLGPGRSCGIAGEYPVIARRALEATGARMVELVVEDEGRRLGAPLERLDLIVVAPAIAAPGRTPLGIPPRRRLLDWAARIGAVVLEDERERELRAHRLASIASLDTEGRVISAGSIPSEIAPGAALGYLVLPRALHGPVAAMVLAGGQAPGRVEQEALASMLESGDFDRDLRRLREARPTPANGEIAGAPSAAAVTHAGWTTGAGLRLRNRP